MSEQRRKVVRRTLADSHADEHNEEGKCSEGGPVLERGAEADAAIIEQRDKPGQRPAR